MAFSPRNLFTVILWNSTQSNSRMIAAALHAYLKHPDGAGVQLRRTDSV